MMLKIKSPRAIFEEQEEEQNKVEEALEGVKDKVEEPIKKIMRRLDFDELKSKSAMDNVFYIGTKDKVEGNILYLSEEQKQKFVLVRVVKKYDRESGAESFHHYFFNEQLPRGSHVNSTIEGEFYSYKLITREQTFQLFSLEKLEIGEYSVWGNIIEALDHCDIGNYAKIEKKQPLLFVHSAFPKENQIQTKKEFFERFEKYELSEDKLIEWLYTSPEGWVYEFPKSFSLIQIANLLGCADEFNSFQLPVLMISETGTGKTTGTELIFNRMKELRGYVDMTSSTLKGLVPSFKSSSNVKAGLLLESKRYVPVDEFFQGISNLHSEEKEKVMETIKNILDYKTRAFASGHGDMKAKMRASHIALTNPKSYGNNMLQLANKFQPENLARYLIWYIPKSQKDFIKEKKGSMKRGDYSYISNYDFLEGVDFLKTFNCDFDRDKVREIVDIGENFLKSKGEEFQNIKAIYSSRYFEHACRLTDAIIKLRCWVEGDKKFKAKAEDYARVKALWVEMLECWSINFLIPEVQSLGVSI